MTTTTPPNPHQVHHQATPHHLSRTQMKRLAMVGFGAGLLALIFLSVVAGWFGTQAQVDIALKTKPIAQDTQVRLDQTLSNSDPSTRTLAAELVEVSIDGSESRQTSGVKLVGDKAKGSVTLINKTDSVKVFNQGTELSSGNLKFTIDTSVTVASASVSTQSSDSETRTFGKADAQVTASAIGTESNLGKDTALKVADFSDSTYTAVAKDALAGGSSREVRVVAEADRKAVLDAVRQNILKEAEKQLKEQAPSDQYRLPTGQLKILSSEYSAEVGEEVDNLALNAKGTVTALSYKTSDLQPLAQAVLGAQIPSGYKLSNQPPSILSAPSSSPAASDSGQIKIDVNLNAQLVPIIDEGKWQKELTRKTKKAGQAYLSSQPEIANATITIEPKLLNAWWPWLPWRQNQIKITTSP